MQKTLSKIPRECPFTSSIFRLRVAVISSFVYSVDKDASVPRIQEWYRRNILNWFYTCSFIQYGNVNKSEWSGS